MAAASCQDSGAVGAERKASLAAMAARSNRPAASHWRPIATAWVLDQRAWAQNPATTARTVKGTTRYTPRLNFGLRSQKSSPSQRCSRASRDTNRLAAPTTAASIRRNFPGGAGGSAGSDSWGGMAMKWDILGMLESQWGRAPEKLPHGGTRSN